MTISRELPRSFWELSSALQKTREKALKNIKSFLSVPVPRPLALVIISGPPWLTKVFLIERRAPILGSSTKMDCWIAIGELSEMSRKFTPDRRKKSQIGRAITRAKLVYPK